MTISAVFGLSLLRFIPHYFLLLYPFRGYFKDTRTRLPLCLGALTAVFLGSVYLCRFTLLFSERYWLLFFLVFDTLASLLLVVTNVELSLEKLLFSFFIIKCCTDNINLLADLLRVFLQRINFITEPAPGFIFSTAFVALALIPPTLTFTDRLLRPFLQDKDSAYQWKKLWLIPLVFFLFFMFNLYLLIFKLNFNSSDFGAVVVIHILATMVAFIASGIILQMLKEEQLKRKLEVELHTVSTSLMLQQREYSRLQDVVEQTRMIRHDVRHNMAVIKALTLQQKYPELLTFLDTYLKTTNINESTLLCENYAVNALVQYYVAQAKNAGIETTVNLNLPKQLVLSDADLINIFGNLLENAIEGCCTLEDTPRFVNLSAAVQGKMLVITIQNNYGQKIVKKDNDFISSKRQGLLKGIGIASVENIARRYQGVAKFDYSSNLFEAQVLLRMNCSLAD